MNQGVNIPGATVTGNTVVNGYTVPVDLAVSSRTGTLPSEYVASANVEFSGEFESTVSDEFVAYISDAGYAGTGNLVAGLSGSGGSYRYGFNGKENDNEVKGIGNQQDYGMRIYDPRLGKFLSVDPLTAEYVGLSPYPFAMNRPIDGIDLDGLEWIEAIKLGAIALYLEYKYGDPTGVKTISTGALEKTLVQTGGMDYHNEKVPLTVQRTLDNSNTNNANAKLIEGSGTLIKWNIQNSLELTSSALPVEEGIVLVGKELFSLVKYSGRARTLSVKTAERLIVELPKEKLPRAVSVIVDKKTGRVYEGISGNLKNLDDIHPKLKDLLPEKSLEKWPTNNCAECDALNKALKDGADIKDLEMHTVKIDKKTKQVQDFKKCENCKIATKEVKTTSER